MSEPLEVTGTIETEVPVITLTYGPEGMLQSSGSELSDRMIKEYEKLAGETSNKSLVVQINAQTAGSPLVRALVNVYKSVNARKGRLVCVNYPLDCLPSLNTLGVTSLPGFRLAQDLKDGIAAVR